MRRYFVSLLCLFSLTSIGQKTPLISRIQTIEKKFNVTFSFDKNLLNEIQVDTNELIDINDQLTFLNNTTAFYFELADGQNVLVSPVEANKNLLIKGKVFDSDLEPIIGASIIIENQNIATTTDVDGAYSIRAKLTDVDTVRINMIGFDELMIALKDWNTKSIFDSVLSKDAIEIDDVLISGYLTNGFLYNHNDQSIDLKADKLGLLPGETEVDILSSLQALPGINSPNGRSGDLVTRGSDPDKTLISYDNIPIYHKGHYFGTFSPFNTEIIDEIKIQRSGGQGSEKGGRVAGIVEITTKNNVIDSFAISTGIGTSYYSATANIPIVKKKLSAIVGFRKSYPASFSSIKIDSLNSFVFQESKVGASLLGVPGINLLDYSFNFWDANAKLTYLINKNHKLEITGISIYNQLELSVEEKMNQITNDTIQQTNWGVNVQLSSNWNRKFTSKFSITNSSYLEDIRGNTLLNNSVSSTDAFVNGSHDFTLKNTNEYKIGLHKKLNFGLESNHYDVTNEQFATTTNSGKQESLKSSNEFLHSAYVDYKNYRAYNFLTFSIGARASYFTGTEKIYFEPRVLTNIHLNKKFTLKANAGKYHQYINHIYGTQLNNLQGINTINWQLSNDKNKPVVESIQSSIGFIWDYKKWVIDFEGYYKETNNITSGNYFTGDSTVRLVHGSYNTAGFDFLVKKKIKKLETWIGYSYMNSNAKFDSLEFKYVWNQTHQFNIVLGYHFKNLKISTGWKYVSGFLNDDIRSRFIGGAPSFITKNPSINTGPQNYVENSDPEYGEYFPDNHQMDLSISYFIKSKKNKWKVVIGGAITNLYDNRIILSQVSRVAPGGQGNLIRINKTGFGRIYNATVKIIWK